MQWGCTVDVLMDPLAQELAALLGSTAHPRERLAQTEATVLARPRGDVQGARVYPPFLVMQAAMRDGYDWRVAQQLFGLFSPSRKIRASAWALGRLRDAAAEEAARQALERAGALIPRPLRPASLHLAIVPADPSNRNLMIRNSGLSVFGEAGRIGATVWPGEGNLARLGPALVRALALAVRWGATGAARRYTLADALAAEGLAAALVAAIFPAAPAPWLLAHVAPAGWPEDLREVAGLYGLSDYERVPANSYGRSEWRSLDPPPAAAPLDAEELAYAEELIGTAIAADDPRAIAAHLYGDVIVAEQGHPQAGLPPYAGFEIAYRLAQRSGLAPGAALGLESVAFLAAAGAC